MGTQEKVNRFTVIFARQNDTTTTTAIQVN